MNVEQGSSTILTIEPNIPLKLFAVLGFYLKNQANVRDLTMSKRSENT